MKKFTPFLLMLLIPLLAYAGATFVPSKTTDLDDWSTTAPTNTQVPSWNSSTNKWTPSNSGGVSGPGSTTDLYVPQWNGTGGNLLRSGVPIDATGGLASKSYVDSATTGGGPGWATVTTYGASGLRTLTTGTVTSGQKSLTVASAASYLTGQGISIANAGTGGNTELVTYIDNIAGNVITLHDAAVSTANSQTVYHDDTRAFTNAIASGYNVFIPDGSYNITSTLTVSAQIQIRGNSFASVSLYNRRANMDVFRIQTSGWKVVDISKIYFYQDPNVTATGGAAIHTGGTGLNQQGNYLHDIWIQSTYDGIWVDVETSATFITDVVIIWPLRYGYHETCPTPYGNIRLTRVAAQSAVSPAATAGFMIEGADLLLCTNREALLFVDNIKLSSSAGSPVDHVMFVGMSSENATSHSVSVTGSYTTQNSFSGEIYGAPIFVDQGTNDTVLNNLVLNGSGSGTGLEVAGTNITVTGVVTANFTTGLLVDSTATNIVVGNSSFHNNTNNITVQTGATPYIFNTIGVPASYAYPLPMPLNFQQKATSKLVFEQGSAFPATPDPANGQIFIKSNIAYLYVAGNWFPLTMGTGAYFMHDTFTGTDATVLSSHTGEIGATWTRHPAYTTNTLKIYSNELDPQGSGSQYASYYSSGTPSSADYTVEALLDIKSTTGVGGYYAGITGRMNNASPATYYWAALRMESGPSQTCELWKFVSGTATNLGSGTACTVSVGNVYDLQLVMTGTTIKLIFNGSTIYTVTDSAIAGPGVAGVEYYNSTIYGQNAGAKVTEIHAF